MVCQNALSPVGIGAEYCHFSYLLQVDHVTGIVRFSTPWFLPKTSSYLFCLVLITKLSIRLSFSRTFVIFRESENLLRFFCHIYNCLTTVFPSAGSRCLSAPLIDSGRSNLYVFPIFSMIYRCYGLTRRRSTGPHR